MKNNNCQGVVDGGGGRTMLRFLLPMLIVIFGTANQVVSEKMDFHDNILMVSSAVFRTELNATSHCSCRVKCIIDKDCTAISAKRDDATGIVDCFYSNETKLHEGHFEDDGTTNTWIMQSLSTGSGLPKDPSSPTALAVTSTTLPSSADTTATNAQVNTTDGQTNGTDSQTSTPNGQTTAMSDQTTTGSSQDNTTLTEATTTASNIITTTTAIETTTSDLTTNLIACTGTNADKDNCFFVGDTANIGDSFKKCWKDGGIQYTSYEELEYANLRIFLKIISITKSEFKKDLLVAVNNHQWLDRFGFTRVPETNEWVNNQVPPADKPCAYVKEGDEFYLEGVSCDTSKEVLCRKQECTNLMTVPGSQEEIFMCQAYTWAKANGVCYSEGGMLYNTDNAEKFTELITYMKANNEVFHKNVWVGVKSGTWISSIPTSAGDWDSGQLSRELAGNKCGVMEKNKDFKLKSYNCGNKKEILCKRQDCTFFMTVTATNEEIMMCHTSTWNKAEQKCWKNGGELYVAQSSVQLHQLIDYLKNEDPLVPFRNLWVGVKKGEWTNGVSTEVADWKDGVTFIKSQGDKCGYLSSDDDFLLQILDCDKFKNVLCKKYSCPSGYILIPGVGCFKNAGSKTWFKQDEYTCTQNGGKIYAPSSDEEFQMLVNYLTNNPDNTLNQDLWVGVKIDLTTKAGLWTNGDPVTAEHWAESPTAPLASQVYCGYLRKDQGFLLMESVCSEVKALLCKLPLPDKLKSLPSSPSSLGFPSF